MASELYLVQSPFLCVEVPLRKQLNQIAHGCPPVSLKSVGGLSNIYPPRICLDLCDSVAVSVRYLEVLEFCHR